MLRVPRSRGSSRSRPESGGYCRGRRDAREKAENVWIGDHGGRSRDAKEARTRHPAWGNGGRSAGDIALAGCRRGEGAGKSEADEEAGGTERKAMWEGEKSRVQERDVGEGGSIYAARAAGRARTRV